MMKKIWQAIAVLYILSAMVMTNRYTREYEKEPYSWVLWYVPYLKGMIWPIVEFGKLVPRTPQVVQKPRPLDTTGESSERAAALKFIEFNNTRHKARDVMNPWKDTPIKDVPRQVWEQISVYKEHMLETGKDLDAEVLNQVYPELGTMFLEKLYKSTKLTSEAAARKDVGAMREVNRIEMEWIEWYNPKISHIAAALKKTLRRGTQ